MVMKGTPLIGNFLPISVFGLLAPFCSTRQSPHGSAIRRAVLSGGELATIVAITLFACCLPGRGLMQYFTTFLMMPHFHERTTPAWQSEPANLTYDQVEDWDQLMTKLGQGDEANAPEILQRLWDKVPQERQAALMAGGSASDEALRVGIIEDINTALLDETLNDGLPIPDDAPRYLELLGGQSQEALDSTAEQALNRGLIELAVEGAVTSRRPGVLEIIPEQMLADPDASPDVALDGFTSGLAQGEESISLEEIPWVAWKRTLLFWIPLIFSMFLAVTGLALVVHRQWSSREHLPYPTIEFARSLLPEEGSLISSIFKNKLFWVGSLIVFGIHMTNYLHVWFPEYVIPIQTRLNFWPLGEIFPVMVRGGASQLLDPVLYFTAIGFAFFLSSGVALSLGVAPYLYCICVGIAASYGFSVSGGHLRASTFSFLCLGGYTGMFVTICYYGRHYYRTVLKRCLGMRTEDEVEPSAIWGARVFIVAGIAFIVQLTIVGVDWQIALLYAFGAIIIYTSMARLLAEAGTFFLHAACYPCAMLLGFMGATALGRDQLLILSMVSSLLIIDPRETLMPFAVTALQLGDKGKQQLGRLATFGMAAIALGLMVAIPVALYWQYQRGAIQTGDWWTVQGIPKEAFNLNTEVARTLEAQGNVELSESLQGWGRFKHLMPQSDLVAMFMLTFSLVLLFTFLRHRFAWWPFHPLIFLVLGTWQSVTMGFSFLLGWAIKQSTMKYGGVILYRKLKPLMIGIVAGEVLAGVVPLIVGAIYYRVTGEPPKPFSILPG
jgi:hypothetical protein